MLSQNDYTILDSLDEVGGTPTGVLRRRLDSSFMPHSSTRKRAAHLRLALLWLMREGLVTEMDGAKPVCWIRTKSGTEILLQHNGEPE